MHLSLSTGHLPRGERVGKDSRTPRELAANLGDAKLKAWMMWRWVKGVVGSMGEMQRAGVLHILMNWLRGRQPLTRHALFRATSR
jgi:hypothetical protein